MDYDEEGDEKLSGNSGTNSPPDSSIIKAERMKLDENPIEHVHIVLESSRLKTFYKAMESANLLSSIGFQDEALKHYASAHSTLKIRMTSEGEVYSTVFYQNCLRYAHCLEYLGQNEKAEEMYLEALPGGGLVAGDYASYLHKKKKDYKLAEKYYKIALEEYPDHSSTQLKYAGFLRHINKDLQGAEKHYKLACEANRKNADALGTYASFLHGVLKRYDEAETYYKVAVREDPTNVNNYCNYGLFLSEERAKFDQAERLYKHAIELEPSHANSLYNYAVMLDTHANRKNEAEELYKNVLHIDRNHPYALYNLAVLLEDKLKAFKQEIATYKKKILGTNYSPRRGVNINIQEAILANKDADEDGGDHENMHDMVKMNLLREDARYADMITSLQESKAIVLDLYERASVADPDDPTAKADCARFIYTEFGGNGSSSPKDKTFYKENYEEKVDLLLNEAYKLDPQLEVTLYTMASVQYNQKQDTAKAESYVKKLLSINSRHVSGMHLLATIYLESSSTFRTKEGRRGSIAGKDKTKSVEEAFSLLQKCAECSKDPSKLLIEYINATSKYGTKRHKLAAIAYCQQTCFFEFTDFQNKVNSDLETAMDTLQAAVGKPKGDINFTNYKGKDKRVSNSADSGGGGDDDGDDGD